jgi:hypothetical protein
MIHADGTGNILADVHGARLRIRIHNDMIDYHVRWHWTIYKPAGEMVLASMVNFTTREAVVEDLCEATGLDPSLFDLPSYA